MIAAEPASPEGNTVYQKYPTCIHSAGGDLSASEEPQQLHSETSARPAVGNKQACCDANGYGRRESSQPLEKLCAHQSEGKARNTSLNQCLKSVRREVLRLGSLQFSVIKANTNESNSNSMLPTERRRRGLGFEGGGNYTACWTRSTNHWVETINVYLWV